MRKSGYDGQDWILVDQNTGNEVHVGDTLTDFRGDSAELQGGTAPHKSNSNGHVSTSPCSRSYASVYGLRWTPIAER